MKLFTWPTALTLVRLVLSPLMLPLLLVWLLPYNGIIINSGLAFLFVLLSLTDFFDGYLARRLNQVSHIGKHLDPLADKFLSYSTLIALLAAHKFFFYWVIILIGRDFFVMGLRNMARDNNFSVPVSFLGKLKTVTQTILLAFIILNPYQKAPGGLGHPWNVAQTVILAIVLLLSLLSAKTYYDHFKKQFGPFAFSGTGEEPLDKSGPEQRVWPEEPTLEDRDPDEDVNG